jgi:hypothetical protein
MVNLVMVNLVMVNLVMVNLVAVNLMVNPRHNIAWRLEICYNPHGDREQPGAAWRQRMNHNVIKHGRSEVIVE